MQNRNSQPLSTSLPTMASRLIASMVFWGSVGQFASIGAIPPQPWDDSPIVSQSELVSESEDENEQRANQLVEQLGSPHFQVRQNAAEQLWQLGVASRPAIARAANHADREIARRAGEILTALDFGIGAQTSPELAKLGSVFHESDPNVRRLLLTQLFRDRRFKLSFQLLSSVEDPTERGELYRETCDLSTQAISLARQSQWEELEYILTHPICLEFDAMTCVYFQYASGRIAALTQQLQQNLSARKNDGLSIDPNQQNLLIHVLRLQQRFDEALAIAETLEDQTRRSQLVQKILMERGDWTTIAQRMVLPDENLSPKDGKFSLNSSQQAIIYHFCDDLANSKKSLQPLIAQAEEFSSNGMELELAAVRNQIQAVALATMDWKTAQRYLDPDQRLETFELLIYLQRYDEAFASIELGASFDNRLVWFERRIRNLNSLRQKIERLQAHGEDADETESDLRKTWNLCVGVTEQLGSLGFTEQATLFYRLLYESLRETESPVHERGQIFQGLLELGQHDAIWELIYADPFQNHNLSLSTYLFPWKQVDSWFWFHQLEERFPDKFTRLKQVAAIIRSPLAFDAVVDIDQEISYLRLNSASLSSAQERAISNLLKYHGRIAESKQYLAAAGEDRDARLQIAMDELLEGKFEKAAGRFDEGLKSGGELTLQLMFSGQCYRGLGRVRDAALRETVAFAHWHQSYRNSQDIASFRELDRLDLLAGFFLVSVYLPEDEAISNELYRALLANSVREQAPLDGARNLRVFVVDSFSNDGTALSRPLYWAELARIINLNQATADIERGNTENACRRMTAVNRFRPGDPELGEKLVVALDRAGAQQEADDLFDSVAQFYFKTLEKYPRSPLHHNNYAWICASAGRKLDHALRHSLAAVAERPLTTNYLDTLAEVYFRLGESEKAVQYSERCTQIAPDKPHYQKQLRRFSD